MKRLVGVIIATALAGGMTIFALTGSPVGANPHTIDCGNDTRLLEVNGSESELDSVVISDENGSPEDTETVTITAADGWWITKVQIQTGDGGSVHDPEIPFDPAVKTAVASTLSGKDISHVDVCVTQNAPTTSSSSTTTTSTTTTTTTVPPTTTTTIGGTEVGGIVEEPRPGAQVLGVTEVPEPAPAPAAEPTEAQPRFTG